MERYYICSGSRLYRLHALDRLVLKETYSDARITGAQKRLKQDQNFSQRDLDELWQKVYAEKQTVLAQRFNQIHTVERAKEVGSIHDIISPRQLRPYLIQAIEEGIDKYLQLKDNQNQQLSKAATL